MIFRNKVNLQYFTGTEINSCEIHKLSRTLFSACCISQVLISESVPSSSNT